MRKWLMNYENSRHNSGRPTQPSEFWASSKYDLTNMTWKEVSEIYLPTLNMRFGAAINSLKKLWKSYKIAGRTGEYRTDTAWKIRKIQSAIGVEPSEFPELEGMEIDDEDLESEESYTEEGESFRSTIAKRGD